MKYKLKLNDLVKFGKQPFKKDKHLKDLLAKK